MGEMADAYLDGAVCSHCGMYFIENHGYPVLCEDCYEDAEETGESQNWAKAIHKLA